MTRFSLTLFLLLCALPTLADPTRYRITPLPGLEVDPRATFINNKGMVAGLNHYFQCKVFLDGWTWTIPILHPDRFDYTETYIGGINDAGTVVGTFHEAADGAWLISYGRAFAWRKGHTFILPKTEKPSDFYDPMADGISNTGNILVRVTDQAPTEVDTFYKTYVYHAGKYRLLPQNAREPEPDKNLFKINRLGQFIRVAYPESVAPLSGYVLETHGVNSAGVIAGQYQRQGILRACIWKNGVCSDLGPDSGNTSNAFAINNKGQVVGGFDLRQGVTVHAFLWQNGRMTDLNTLIPAHSGWVLTEADAINDRGQIVCAGNKGACLLTPIASNKRRP